MLTVHHLGHSQSERVVWLCEELGIEYELKKYDRAPLLSPPEYQALHPTGSAPVITDGDITLAESQACIEYIANIYGGGRFLVKPGSSGYANYLYWYHVANGSYQPALTRILTLKFAGVKPDEQAYQWLSGKVQTLLAQYDKRLSTTHWLAGDEFTVADIMVVFSLTTMREFIEVDQSDYPNVLAYLERIVERPAYKKSVEKGDPDKVLADLIGGKPPPQFTGPRK